MFLFRFLKAVFATIVIISTTFIKPTFCLTLEEAVSEALSKYHPIREKAYEIKEKKDFYISSFDPYFPRLDLNFGYERTLRSDFFLANRERNFYSTSLEISYKIFDGGRRYSEKEIAKRDLISEKEKLSETKLDLIYTVKKLFYDTLAKKEIIKAKEKTVFLAKKDYMIAQAKREVGLSKFSDVTQAKVRYINTKYELSNAKRDYEKSLGELMSFLGRSPDVKEELCGKLFYFKPNFEFKELREFALKNRPEIKIEKERIEKANMEVKSYLSEYFPKIYAFYKKRYEDSKFFPKESEDVVGINLTFPIFYGPVRYFRISSAKRKKKAFLERLYEIKRQISLEVYKSLKDLQLSFDKVLISKELLEEASVNYKQELGEYKEGKGNIISLIQSEISLADARILLIKSMCDFCKELSKLERATAKYSLKRN